MKHKIFVFFLAALIGTGNMFAEIYSGTCGAQGDNLTWNLDTESGTLTISGTGDMADYSYSSSAPWHFSRSFIEIVTISDGITYIGDHAFYNCIGLTSVTIPNSVTSIGTRAFEQCSSLTSIVIPNNVTNIGYMAFHSCSGLTSLTIPSSVRSIGDGAFAGCTGLISISVEEDNVVYDSRENSNAIIETATNTLMVGCLITLIPNSVTSIGGSAFDGCSGLTSLTIPSSVTSIGYGAFYGCSSLTSLTIPNSVTSIGDHAFNGCSGLTSVMISNSVTSISYHAFSNCSSLTSVTIPNSVTSIREGAFYKCSSLTSVVIPNSVMSVGLAAFRECTGLTSVAISNSVTSVEDLAFSNCSSLTSVTIPNSVTSIGNSTFSGCSSLTSLTCETVIPPTLGSYVFYAIDKSIPLYVPSESVNLYKAADQWKDFLNILPIGETPTPCINASGSCGAQGDNLMWELSCDGVLTISGTGDMADYQILETPWNTIKEQIKSVIVEDGVTTVGNWAFYQCYGITSVTLPNGLTKIGENAFASCYLDSINLPNTIETIEFNAFANCWRLQSITIPDGVSTLEDGVFERCESLKSIYIGKNLSYINNRAIYECHSFEAFYVSEENEYYSAVDGVLFNKDKTTLCIYPCAKTGDAYTIPQSVTEISSFAFERVELKKIIIPEGVILFGEYAFHECRSLVDINLPSHLTEIADGLFDYCSKLPQINIPNTITKIGRDAFQGCDSLKQVIIPNGITSIGVYAFRDCSSLTTITLPESLTSLGSSAFLGCNALTSIYVEDNNQYYCDVDGVLFNRDTTTLIQYPASKGSVYIIPDGVKTIGDGAFYYYGNLLTEITIPASVTKLETFAFIGCTGLTFVKCKAITPPAMESNVFRFIDFSIPLYVPEESIEAYKAANGWKDFTNILPIEEEPAPCLIASGTCGAQGDNLTWELSCDSVLTISGTGDMRSWNGVAAPWYKYKSSIVTVVLQNGVTNIGFAAFKDCPNMVSIDIPESVTRIEGHAFYESTSLTSVTIPNSVTSIEWAAFYRCSGMTNVIISDGVKSIGSEAFYGCSGLMNVTIPNSVVSIGTQAFNWCTGLTSVTIGNSVKTIEQGAFHACSALTSIELPNSVTSIGESVFENCTNLTSVTIPSSITTIAMWAFRNCTSLTNVTIPEGVISIGQQTFEGCSGLTSITIGNSVTSIGHHAFKDCSGLTSVMIPNSVTSIGQSAFTDCANLTEINVAFDNPSFCSVDGILFNKDKTTLIQFPSKKQVKSYLIPNSVTTIDYRAFAMCTELASVVIGDNVTSIGTACFSNCKGLTNVTIGNGVTSIREATFELCSNLTSVIIGNNITDIGELAFYSCSALTSITCKAIVPPSCGEAVFLNINKSIPLYVPAMSISAYQTADQWKAFTNILPIETTPQFTVTTLSNNEEWGTLTGGDTYDANTEVSIGAFAADGYQFYCWNNSIKENPHTFTLTQDTSFVATFLPNTEENIVSDVTSNSVHMEWEVKPWGNHGYWVWIFVDKDHQQWYCRMRLHANGELDKFYWGPASKHYDGSGMNRIDSHCIHRTPVKYSEAPDVLSYDLTELEPARTYFYILEGVDQEEQVISVLAGTFTTADSPTMLDRTQDNQSSAAIKVLSNGQLIIRKANKSYTPLGQTCL